jgi:arylsulfatase A-like enzyme
MVLTYRDGGAFPGRVGTTLADSVAAWPMAPRAPQNSLNVVLVVLDDVGYAQLGCFGSDIDTPNIDALAARGLRYRSFHTTAMCSPTRACLLTGRNHHTCAIGGITDLAMGFPGYNGRIPKSCGFVSEVLRQEGWATLAIGKWHLAPSDEVHAAAPRDRWPLGQGFERYYGFIGAETNHWAPDLVNDNTVLRGGAFPPGYHLTEDLTDQAITMVSDLRAVDANKPFFMYYALGACHAPHHAPREWIDAYRGRFDAGWDEWRRRTHARQIDSGLLPAGTALSQRPEWVQEWATLPADEQRAYARMMEVYAGFLSHADHHIGRLIDFLDASGELDRTVVMLLSDNGASAEGGPFGTFNENFLFNGLPHDLAETMARLDDLGGPNSYGHYPWGWAYAGNTPFKRWKRETHEGGIGDPLIVAVPPSLGPDRGAVRHQYVHAVDIGATILDACGVTMPATLNGVAQEPLAGASLLASIRDGGAAEHRTTQYYEQFACRAIYHEGWKAVAFHSMGIVRYTDSEQDNPSRPFATDVWELYNVAVDPAETHDLAADEPERLRKLQDLWWQEAGRYGALPLQSTRAFAPGRPEAIERPLRTVFRPGAAPVPEEVAPNTKLRPHRIVAVIDVADAVDSHGVLLAQGGRFGGFSLWLRDGVPRYSYNFAGLDLTTIVAPNALTAGRHVVGVELAPAQGRPMSFALTLFVDGVAVAAADIARTSPFRFTLAGEGLCCGYDDGTPVADYASPFAFTGTIHEVAVDVSGDPYVDVEQSVAHAWVTQ